MTHLKYCPHCGETAWDRTYWHGTEEQSHIVCGHCGATAPTAEIWNERVHVNEHGFLERGESAATAIGSRRA